MLKPRNCLEHPGSFIIKDDEQNKIYVVVKYLADIAEIKPIFVFDEDYQQWNFVFNPSISYIHKTEPCQEIKIRFLDNSIVFV